MITFRWPAAILIACLATALGPGPATASRHEPDELRAQVYERLNDRLGEVPASYIILIDKSGSMLQQNKYGQVAEALRSFLNGIGSRDSVTLYTFDSTPQKRFPKAVVTNPDAVVRLLYPGPTARASTDIGRALKQALADLSADTNPLRAVVLISDGEQDPELPGYDPGGTSQAWKELKDTAAGLSGVKAYALEIGGARSGVALGYVFKDPIVLRAQTPGLIAAVLDEAKQAVTDTKVASLMAEDASAAARIDWPSSAHLDMASGQASVEVTITSTAKYLPLVVSGLRATVDGNEAMPAPLPDFQLEPGQSKSVRMDLVWPGGRPLMSLPFDSTADVAFSGTVVTPWARYLDSISAHASPTLTGTPVASAADTAGYLSVSMLAAILAALGILLYTVRWLNTHRRMAGAMLACQEPDQSGTYKGKVLLSGRSAKLAGIARIKLNGPARVRRLASPWWSRRTAPVYSVTYSATKDFPHEDTGACPINGSVLVNGVRFCHVADLAGPPDSVTCACAHTVAKLQDQLRGDDL